MNTIRFRLLKNHRIDLCDAVTYSPSVTFYEREIPHLKPKKAILAKFDIGPESTPHVVRLRSEDAELPADFDSLQPDMQKEIRAEAVRDAIQRRKLNADIHDALRHYEREGVIEILSATDTLVFNNEPVLIDEPVDSSNIKKHKGTK
jgi:hypothetical protein